MSTSRNTPTRGDDDSDFRMISLSRTQRNQLALAYDAMPDGGASPQAFRDVVDKWDKAPDSAWDEIADEFKRHRCKDGNCFAETVLSRLGALSFSLGPFDLPPPPEALGGFPLETT